MKIIPASDLVIFDDFITTHPLRVDTVYAKPAHKDNMFKEAIYRQDARMVAHRDLAAVTLRAAEICYKQSGYIFELKDCLRPLEAQQKIIDTKIVRDHPQWLEEPRLFSPPGKGGHPRGMAVDAVLIDENGDEIDMGTAFDYLTEDKSNNPAARDYADFGKGAAYNKMVFENRQLLETSFLQAAQELGQTIWPLPQEWWDFRFSNDYTASFAPIRDADLPPALKMMD